MSPAVKAIVVGVGVGGGLVVALLVAMAMLKHGPAQGPAADLATLLITPNPAEGAQISIDGRQLVESEHHTFVARELVPGDHVIEGRNANGLKVLKVSLLAGATKPVQLEMAAAAPTVPTPPTGPAVAVGPEPHAPTGATGAAVPPPPPPVVPEVVNAPPNTPVAPTGKMGLDLSHPTAAPVQVVLQTDPADAEIFVDRQSVGHGPYTLTSTDPGHLYHLKAVAPGHRPAEKNSRFAEAQTVTLVLKEGGAEHASGGGGGHHRVKGGPPGTLIISSRPVAKVFVDGRSTERYTPVAPSDPLEIPSGDHTIHLESDDGKKADRQVSIQPHTLTKLLGVTLN